MKYSRASEDCSKRVRGSSDLLALDQPVEFEIERQMHSRNATVWAQEIADHAVGVVGALKMEDAAGALAGSDVEPDMADAHLAHGGHEVLGGIGDDHRALAQALGQRGADRAGWQPLEHRHDRPAVAAERGHDVGVVLAARLPAPAAPTRFAAEGLATALAADPHHHVVSLDDAAECLAFGLARRGAQEPVTPAQRRGAVDGATLGRALD